MPRVRNTTLLDVPLQPLLGGLRRARLPRRSESLIAARARTELKVVLRRVVDAVRTDYGRSGAAYNYMRHQGVRVTGTSLRTVHGKIIGPIYIKLLEDGGTVAPKNARALAIPIHDGLRPDGTPKLPGPRSWSNIKKTFIYKSVRTGKRYIAYKEGDTIRIIYVLLQKTEFKARGLLRKAWNTNRASLANAVGDAFSREISKVSLLGLARITTSGGGRRR